MEKGGTFTLTPRLKARSWACRMRRPRSVPLCQEPGKDRGEPPSEMEIMSRSVASVWASHSLVKIRSERSLVVMALILLRKAVSPFWRSWASNRERNSRAIATRTVPARAEERRVRRRRSFSRGRSFLPPLMTAPPGGSLPRGW